MMGTSAKETAGERVEGMADPWARGTIHRPLWMGRGQADQSFVIRPQDRGGKGVGYGQAGLGWGIGERWRCGGRGWGRLGHWGQRGLPCLGQMGRWGQEEHRQWGVPDRDGWRWCRDHGREKPAPPPFSCGRAFCARLPRRSWWL